MTQAEWLACEDPQRMLEFVRNPAHAGIAGQPYISERKLRLFAGVCRELYADVRRRVYDESSVSLESAYYWSVEHKTDEEQRGKAALLRDIVGNPWRPVRLAKGPQCWMCAGDGKHYKMDGVFECERCEGAGVDPCPWLIWNDGTVPKLARSICDARKWDEMGVLRDALIEAGCTDEDILWHLHGEERYLVMERPKVNLWGWRPMSNPHVLGCWVLDLLLGKD